LWIESRNGGIKEKDEKEVYHESYNFSIGDEEEEGIEENTLECDSDSIIAVSNVRRLISE
jgi:hypothetical protein